MGFIKRNGQKKEKTDSTENKEYLFPEEAELKACRYCQTMIPKTAKVCPNCRKRLKKNWLGIFLLLCLLAACAAGVYYFVVYSVTERVSSVSVDAEIVPHEAVRDVGESGMPEDGLQVENTVENVAETEGTGIDASMQLENLPEIPAALDGTEVPSMEENSAFVVELENAADKEDELEAEGEKGSAADKEDELEAEGEKGSAADKEDELEAEGEKGSAADKEDELEKEAEDDKEDELKDESELGKNDEDEEDMIERRKESEDTAEKNDRAGMTVDAGTDDEPDAVPESGADPADGTTSVTDMSAYTEEEFRDICRRIDYKKLLRSQELYLNAAVVEELIVIEPVDGGLFDENIYYLCKREDAQNIMRYYIVRDDREEDAVPILEGDVLRVYGQLFGSCKLPGYLVKTQPVVPALTMVYFDLLED